MDEITAVIKAAPAANSSEKIMSKWKYKLNIKRHITDSLEWSDLSKAANSIAAELRKLPQSADGGALGFIDDINFLEGVNEQDCEVYSHPVDLRNEINFRLSSIYDFADAEHIWLG